MRDGTEARSGGVRRWYVALLHIPALLLCLAIGCLTPPAALLHSGDDDEKELKVETVGDVTDVANVNTIALSGVGLVVGLEGTGGSPPPCYFRTMLEEELRKKNVKNIKELLESPDNAMVLVSAVIPSGSRQGDPLDIEVYLPGNSKATSLRGGYLTPCYMRDSNTTKNLKPDTKKNNAMMEGHILARAQGTVLTGFGGDDEAGLRRGRIWEGAASFIDRPFLLILKNDRKFDRIAASLAQRINTMYQDDPERQRKVLEHKRLLLLQQMTDQINESFPAEKFRAPALGKGEVARPLNKQAVYVNVPWQYRLCPERYLRVVRLMPFRATAEEHNRYRSKLQALLLDPAKTVRGALRLEALGRSSVPALKEGLKSDHPLVRFCSAEALAYLGSPSGAEELARLARQFVSLRASCLIALGSLDEVACHEKLAELLESGEPELRYGAFRALRLLDETEPHVQGSLLGESFWLHKVEVESSPLVHFTWGQRAEVVLFGGGQRLVPPVDIRAHEFTIRADENDDRCIVKRFMPTAKRIEQRLCSLKLEDVLKTMADLGAQYPDVVELLRSLDELKAASCPICCNALPPVLPTEELFALGRDPNAWRATTAEAAASSLPPPGSPQP
jgi:hypothetical protein